MLDRCGFWKPQRLRLLNEELEGVPSSNANARGLEDQGFSKRLADDQMQGMLRPPSRVRSRADVARKQKQITVQYCISRDNNEIRYKCPIVLEESAEK